MPKLILVLLICFGIGILYSSIISKFTRNSFLLFLPTIIGALWFIYVFTLYKPKQSEGFGDLAIVIYAMMILSIIVGNIISSIYFIYKKRNH